MPLEDKFYDEVRIRAEFSNQNKIDEAFMIEIISDEEKKDILFLKSFIGNLMLTSKFLKEDRTLSIDNQLLLDTEFQLKKIICFLFDLEFEHGIDYSSMDFSKYKIKESR